jgi:hypothetical protein
MLVLWRELHILVILQVMCLEGLHGLEKAWLRRRKLQEIVFIRRWRVTLLVILPQGTQSPVVNVHRREKGRLLVIVNSKQRKQFSRLGTSSSRQLFVYFSQVSMVKTLQMFKIWLNRPLLQWKLRIRLSVKAKNWGR